MIYNYFYIKSHSYSVFKMSDLEIFGKYQNPIKYPTKYRRNNKLCYIPNGVNY